MFSSYSSNPLEYQNIPGILGVIVHPMEKKTLGSRTVYYTTVTGLGNDVKVVGVMSNETVKEAVIVMDDEPVTLELLDEGDVMDITSYKESCEEGLFSQLDEDDHEHQKAIEKFNNLSDSLKNKRLYYFDHMYFDGETHAYLGSDSEVGYHVIVNNMIEKLKDKSSIEEILKTKSEELMMEIDHTSVDITSDIVDTVTPVKSTEKNVSNTPMTKLGDNSIFSPVAQETPFVQTASIVKKAEKEAAKYEMYKDIAYFNTPEEELEYEKKTQMKCRICDKNKFLTEYSNNTSGRQPFDCNGYRLKRKECKDCQKKEGEGKRAAERLAKKQGIKKPESTHCELCNKVLTKNKIIFDHCHATDKFRGWLCDPCNRSMGVLGDNIEGLLKCIHYINKTEKKKFTVVDNEIKFE